MMKPCTHISCSLFCSLTTFIHKSLACHTHAVHMCPMHRRCSSTLIIQKSLTLTIGVMLTSVSSSCFCSATLMIHRSLPYICRLWTDISRSCFGELAKQMGCYHVQQRSRLCFERAHQEQKGLSNTHTRTMQMTTACSCGCAHRQ